MNRIVSLATPALALAGLVLILAGCAKEEVGWERFARTDEGKHSYAPESIFRKTEAIVAVTEQVRHDGGSKTYRVEFHCAERLYVRTLIKETEPEGGKEAATFHKLTSRPPMEKLPPGSPAERLFGIVCEIGAPVSESAPSHNDVLG